MTLWPPYKGKQKLLSLIPSKSAAVPALPLTFEQICPTWSTKLRVGLDKDDIHILTHKPDTCIVGEAWGYTSRYQGYDLVCLAPFIGCWKCTIFGMEIGKTARKWHMPYTSDHNHHLQPIIDDFVKHWNKEHLDITLRKKNKGEEIVTR
jgi:hypothetical protein